MENIFYDLGLAVWSLVQPLASAFAPLLTGLFLAYLLYPAVKYLTPKTGVLTAILLTYLLLFSSLAALAGGFAVLILGALPTDGLSETAAAITAYFQNASQAIGDFTSKHLPWMLSDTGDASAGLESWFAHHLSLKSITSAISSLSGAAVTFFLGIIASIYLLKDRDFFLLLWHQFLSLILKQNHHGMLCEILHEINTVIYAFLKAALIDSLIVAFLSSIALSLLQVNFAVVIGVLGGLLNLIPYFGPVFGMIPAFIAAFFEGGLAKSAASVLVLLLVQQADANFIYPHIVGNSTGLHPLFVLLSVSVFGYFFGLAGMLLAVPAAGILQIFIKRWAFR